MSMVEGLDPVLKCPICTNPYNSDHYIPYIIPCKENHTICSQCLSSLLSKPGKFHCPLDGTTPINAKGKDKLEFELNKSYIEALEDNCIHHPNRKLDLICRQCRCKICLACEKKGNHQGHETLLVEEYEKKYITKLEDTQQCFVKIRDIQTSREAILRTKEKEVLQNIESLVLQFIEKINGKKVKMDQEISQFFQKLRQDQEMGLPNNNPHTSTFLSWRNATEEKLLKLKETNPFSEESIKFVDLEKVLVNSELDAWIRLSRNSLHKLERDLEEVSVRLKIELETTLEEIDVLDLKIKLDDKQKKNLQFIEIATRDYQNDNENGSNSISHHQQKYREKEINRAFEYIKELISGSEAIQEEIVPGVGLSLRSAEDVGIQALSDMTQESKKLKVWTKHIKSLALGCTKTKDEDMEKLKKVLESLNALTIINLNFTENAKITEVGYIALSEAIGQLHQLKQLEFNFSWAAHLTAQSLEKFLIEFSNLGELNHLNINFTGCKDINDQSLVALASNFQRLQAIQNITLCFKDVNNVGDNGLLGFGKSLSGLSKLQLLHLDFSGNPNVTDKGLIDLTQALYHLNDLKFIALNFDWNSRITDNGLDEVGWALSHLLQITQISLNFKKASISAYGLEELVKSVSHLSQLAKLELNFVGTLGLEKSLEKIGVALSSLASLNEILLSFTWNTNEDSIFDRFVQTLNGLKNLTTISLKLVGSGTAMREALKAKFETNFPNITANIEG